MEGYSVTEAASVLGVPTERVWELLARGILSGAPDGDTGMRVFLQPRPAPAPPERSRTPDGDGGGRDTERTELSPFRELLTEFRNLTERYGQALLALGEARGEVASLRSRVDLLEARMDLRLPPAPAPTAWDAPMPSAARPRSVPSEAEDAPSRPAALEPAVELGDADIAEPALPAEQSPDPSHSTSADAQPDAAQAPTADDGSSEDGLTEDAAADAGTASPAGEPRAARRGGSRHATENFAEALARAQDPSIPELPGGSAAAAALAAVRSESAADAQPGDAGLPREVAPADAVPVADEMTGDPAGPAEPGSVDVPIAPAAEPPSAVAAGGDVDSATDLAAAIEEPGAETPPDDFMPPAPAASDDAAPEAVGEVAVPQPIQPDPEDVLAETAEGETDTGDAAVSPAQTAEPAADQAATAEPETPAWQDERYTAEIPDPDWFDGETFAPPPQPPPADDRVTAVSEPTADSSALDDPDPSPSGDAGDAAEADVTPEPPVAELQSTDPDAPGSAAGEEAPEAAAAPGPGAAGRAPAAEPGPAPGARPASTSGSMLGRLRPSVPAEPEETVLWFGREPEDERPSPIAGSAGTTDASAIGPNGDLEPRTPPDAPARGLDDALAALDALSRSAAGMASSAPAAEDRSDVAGPRRPSPPTPATRAYRRLRRIFPG